MIPEHRLVVTVLAGNYNNPSHGEQILQREEMTGAIVRFGEFTTLWVSSQPLQPTRQLRGWLSAPKPLSRLSS